VSGAEHIRVPPHSNDAECSVLGGLMLDPDRIDDVAAALSDQDFYSKRHRTIFQAMLDLSAQGTPCDAVTLGDWFETQGLADIVGGSAYVLQLANNTPSAANIGAYAQIVRQKSVLRRVIDIATGTAEGAFARDADAGDVVDAAVRALMELHRVDQNAEWTMRQAVKKAYEHLATVAADPSKAMGVPSGLEKLDECLGGFHPADLIVFAGRPAMGKTALLLGCATHAAEKGYPVGLISAEMAAEQCGARGLALYSNIPASRLRNAAIDESDWPRITSGVTKLRDLPMWIFDRSAIHIDELCRVARRWKQQHGIRALYIDYLQRIMANGTKKWEVVAEVVFRLKCLARELGIPVIVLAQVKREVEQRGDKRPHMADICDSSEIEKEADQVITIYRDDYYNDESEDKGTAELIVDKNRHGPTGYVRVAFLATVMRFANLGYAMTDYAEADA
jgi:replicative DNA helicase